MSALMQDHTVHVDRSWERAGKREQCCLTYSTSIAFLEEGQHIKLSRSGSPAVIGITSLRPVALRPHPLE